MGSVKFEESRYLKRGVKDLDFRSCIAKIEKESEELNETVESAFVDLVGVEPRRHELLLLPLLSLQARRRLLPPLFVLGVHRVADPRDGLLEL